MTGSDENALVGELSEDEWHTFVNGFYCGATFTSAQGRRGLNEVHYWRAGYLAGTFLRYTTFVRAFGYVIDKLQSR